MFFCGNFCNGGLEQPQIIVSNINEARDYERYNSQIHASQIKSANGTFAMIKRSKYKYLKEECLKNNSKFVDKQFPANQRSLNFSIPNRQITWKRISDFLPNCVMEENGINPADIQQGNIGDCYFLASISALAENPQRIKNIFLDNFELNGNCIYKVIACVEGVMTEVVIDDFVPVYASTNRPVFCKANGREIWVMLLEKAWAKIKGSYGDISAGTPHEVLNTFCLAPCYNHQIHDTISEDYKENLWKGLVLASQLDFPTCAGSRQKVELNGLKPLHTYTVLSSINVPLNGKYHKIMRLRNPWGQTEYTGFASESDTKFWSQVPKQIKDQILPRAESNDGDFTIPYSEFLKNFQTLDACHFRSQFSFEFQKLHMTRSAPTFVKLDVKEDHETYISVQKIFAEEDAKLAIKKMGNYGYLKMIIAKETEPQRYQYFDSKLQTNYGDLTINCKLKVGRYIIMIQGDYPEGYKEFDAIFSYYYHNLKEKLNKTINVQNYDRVHFLNEVFLNHAYRMSTDITKLSARPNDWIKSTLLYEQGGYGYIAISLQQETTFKLHITVDYKAIQQQGYKPIKQIANEFDLQGESVSIFVFELDLNNKNIKQLEFPPEGFKISKIV